MSQPTILNHRPMIIRHHAWKRKEWLVRTIVGWLVGSLARSTVGLYIPISLVRFHKHRGIRNLESFTNRTMWKYCKCSFEQDSWAPLRVGTLLVQIPYFPCRLARFIATWLVHIPSHDMHFFSEFFFKLREHPVALETPKTLCLKSITALA